MILSNTTEDRPLRGRRGKKTGPSSNALTDGVAWLFEALRATDYYDERILRSHERLPLPERAQMARAYYDVLPEYEQILIYRAASLPSTGAIDRMATLQMIEAKESPFHCRPELTRARSHVFKARLIIQRQRELIAELKKCGSPVSQAERTLQIFASNLEVLEHHKHVLEDGLTNRLLPVPPGTALKRQSQNANRHKPVSRPRSTKAPRALAERQF